MCGMVHKFALLLTILILVLIQMTVVPDVVASDGTAEIVAARVAVQHWIEGRVGSPVPPSWKGAVVGDGITCRNLDGGVIAYLFTINNAGKAVGYLIVGANAYNYTVFEIGSVPPPTVGPALARVAISKIGSLPDNAVISGPLATLYTGPGSLLGYLPS